MLEKVVYNFLIATESIMYNKTRAILTSLGIIFGVASVISMLAIGSGAQQEILSQLKLLGANNIIITPNVEQQEGRVGEGDSGSSEEGEAEGEDGEDGPLTKKRYSPGLTLADAESMLKHIPGVETVSPEVIVETVALRSGMRRSTKLVGVDETYFNGGDFRLSEGSYFSEQQRIDAAPVAIIGHDIRTKFFAGEEPIGRQIKCGRLWLTVVGVLEPRNVNVKSLERLGVRNFDLDIYTPISTMLLRYENRALLTADDIRQAQRDRRRGIEKDDVNYNQLDRLVVRVEESSMVKPVAEIISRMLERRHYGIIDYEVVVPEVLLQQEQRTQNIFNIVLAAIASISLLVGGIGIMNIMLASVMERIREIGVRRSVGATRRDIILQFLIEAVTLSFTGGVIGILLGMTFSYGISATTDIITQVSVGSVLLAFLVSVAVGVLFGLLPAKRAAEQDPVTSLRHGA